MDAPDAVEFVCQRCDRTASPSAINRSQGACPRCEKSRWQVRVTYQVVEEEGLSSGAATAINVVGIGLTLATGQGFAFGGGQRRKVSEDVAIYMDVPGHEVLEACRGATSDSLAALVERLRQQEADAHRARMASRGARPCGHCGVLVVPVDGKPWTTVGACSKVCCARMFGAARYADVEAEIIGKNSGQLGEKPKKRAAKIDVKCICGQTFQAPRAYIGARRACPHCKVLNAIDES